MKKQKHSIMNDKIIQELQSEVNGLRMTLVTLISWMSSSANSSLSHNECQLLIKMTEKRVEK